MSDIAIVRELVENTTSTTEEVVRLFRGRPLPIKPPPKPPPPPPQEEPRKELSA